MIRFLLIFWFIVSCIRLRAAPWNFFQLNAQYFNQKKGIFSKLDTDQFIPDRWRLPQFLEDGKTIPNNFPVFIKPEWGQNSHGIQRADSLEHFQQTCERIATKDIAYIVQEAAKEQREFEVFYIRSPPNNHIYSFLSITEVRNSTKESLPINGIHNANTIYTDFTPEFTSGEIDKLWEYLNDIGTFRLARVGLRANSKEELLAGLFHIIEINLFLPMPLRLLDAKIARKSKLQFVRQCMFCAAQAVKAIPKEQKRQPIFFNKLIAHYKVKS